MLFLLTELITTEDIYFPLEDDDGESFMPRSAAERPLIWVAVVIQPVPRPDVTRTGVGGGFMLCCIFFLILNSVFDLE